jgi:hypothetical protein
MLGCSVSCSHSISETPFRSDLRKNVDPVLNRGKQAGKSRHLNFRRSPPAKALKIEIGKPAKLERRTRDRWGAALVRKRGTHRS